MVKNAALIVAEMSEESTVSLVFFMMYPWVD